MKYFIINKFKKSNQDGLSLVEMAVVAILFFTLIFGIIDFALLMYNQHILSNAAREAARAGIVSRPDGYKITEAEVENIARSYAEAYLITFGVKDFVPDASFESGTGQCENFQEELIVKVSYRPSFLFLPFDLDKIEARAVMLCE